MRLYLRHVWGCLISSDLFTYYQPLVTVHFASKGIVTRIFCNFFSTSNQDVNTKNLQEKKSSECFFCTPWGCAILGLCNTKPLSRHSKIILSFTTFLFLFLGSKKQTNESLYIAPLEKIESSIFRDVSILLQGDVFFIFLEALRSVLRRLCRFALDIHVKAV